MSTIPSLALIPSGYKASKVYSVLPTDGTGDFDFSRSGNATRVNKDGLIELVGNNEPRLNYPMIDGVVSGCPSLLLEPTRSNVIQYSEDFSNASWFKGGLTVIANQAISPDGSQNADEITPDATTGAIRIWQTETTSATTYSLSFFVKYNGKQYVQLLFGSLLNSVDFSNFDLINGTVTLGAGEIESFGNGWYKISLTASLNAATDQVYLWSIDSATSSRGASSTGNGSDGYFVWGAQLEEGSYATSYIPTQGSIGTRVAESCEQTPPSGIIGQTEGVIYVEAKDIADDGSTKMITLNDGGQTNEIRIDFRTSNSIQSVFTVGGSPQAVISTSSYNSLEFNKIAFKYKENDFALWVNGVKVGVDTNGSTNATNVFSVLEFKRGSGLFPFYGSTKNVKLYNTALTDTQLQQLTS